MDSIDNQMEGYNYDAKRMGRKRKKGHTLGEYMYVVCVAIRFVDQRKRKKYNLAHSSNEEGSLHDEVYVFGPCRALQDGQE